MSAARQVRVCLQHVPGCPLVDAVRERLHEALRAATISAIVEEVEGAYPSPTLLVDGIDAATGLPGSGAPRCRLDLPTIEQIATCLTRRGAVLDDEPGAHR